MSVNIITTELLGTPPFGLINILYADLVTLINGSQLVIGQDYLITDFTTKHYIVDYTSATFVCRIYLKQFKKNKK